MSEVEGYNELQKVHRVVSVAQRLERLTVDQEVEGSNPSVHPPNT